MGSMGNGVNGYFGCGSVGGFVDVRHIPVRSPYFCDDLM